MVMSRRWRVGAASARLLLILLVAAGTASPASGQEREQRRDCRCVDREGRELENCVCIRTPEAALRGALAVAGARARIGVSLEEHARGARVSGVREDSPAEEAGVREGDVIVRVDGRSLLEPLPEAGDERRIDEDGDVAVQRLMVLARQWEPGEEVELEVLRDGERLTLEVEPEEAPGNAVALFGEGRSLHVFPDGPRAWSFQMPEGGFRLYADSLRPEGGFRFYADSLRLEGDSARRLYRFFRTDSLPRPRAMVRVMDECPGEEGAWAAFGRDCAAGLRLVEVNPELGEYFGTSAGVLVAEVAEGSGLGLLPGDVILAIGGRTVDDPADARRILASYRTDEEVTFRIVRKQQETEVRGTRD